MDAPGRGVSLRARYRSGDGIFTSFERFDRIYRTMGLPLRETLTCDNEPHGWCRPERPDLFLWEEWAVCMGGDPVQTALDRARAAGPHYELVERSL